MPSHRRIKIIVNGNPYLVEVGDLSESPLTVTVNGKAYQVAIDGGGEKSDPGENAPPSSTDRGEAPLRSGSAGSNINAITSPMPGNIIDIAVKPGETVARDQVLCTLEAMKMRNAIRSPRDGVIASVVIDSGQAVGYGDILFTFQ
jgi:biotin carboxyl carrier protein